RPLPAPHLRRRRQGPLRRGRARVHVAREEQPARHPHGAAALRLRQGAGRAVPGEDLRGRADGGARGRPEHPLRHHRGNERRRARGNGPPGQRRAAQRRRAAAVVRGRRQARGTVRARARPLRHPGRLPLGCPPHAARAAQHHRRGVLPRPALQAVGRGPLLPDAHRQRPGGAGAQQPRVCGGHGDPRGVPGPRLALQVPHAERARDLQHPLADPRLRGGLRLHVAGLDGGRGVGAVLRGADVRARRGAPVRLLHGRRVHVRAPGAAAARRAHRGGRGDAHRPHDLRPGGRLLHGQRQLLPQRPRPRGERPHREGGGRGRPARHLPLQQVAHAGDHLQPGQERHHPAARGVPAGSRLRLHAQGVPRALHEDGDDPARLLPRIVPGRRAPL
ncbi:MAG: hypothetical protein AVDCRST_MAG89-2675, partial [uncultured Gemmatimonadetes bacterium]